MTTNQSKPNISFEFFPFKSDKEIGTFADTVQILNTFEPRFFSVTHGAFASSTSRSDEMITLVQQNTTKPVAAHVTTCNLDKTTLLNWVAQLYQQGVRHIVALRGDNKAKMTAEHYQNAAELVAALRERYSDIEISVAGYPEMHKEAKSKQADLDYLKLKLDSGADNLITQFYFDTNALYEFKNDLARLGVDKPIIAGILPVGNFTKMLEMAEYCKVSVPDAMRKRYEAVGEDSKAQAELAVTTSIELVNNTSALGIHDFHFYCMNKAKTVKAIIEGL